MRVIFLFLTLVLCAELPSVAAEYKWTRGCGACTLQRTRRGGGGRLWREDVVCWVAGADDPEGGSATSATTTFGEVDRRPEVDSGEIEYPDQSQCLGGAPLRRLRGFSTTRCGSWVATLRGALSERRLEFTTVVIWRQATANAEWGRRKHARDRWFMTGSSG